MRRRWPLLAILCVLASLLVPGIASASTAADAESRVGAFDFPDQVCVGVERSLTLELRPGCAPTYDEIATESLLAARGGRSIWSSTKSKSAIENAFGHRKKHRSEFPEFQNAKQYVEGANRFVTNPPSGTLTRIRANGGTLFYHPESNTFAVRGSDGAPRTMFRPEAGRSYWNGQ